MFFWLRVICDNGVEWVFDIDFFEKDDVPMMEQVRDALPPEREIVSVDIVMKRWDSNGKMFRRFI